MSSANEVKREFEGKLCEATANETYLYNRVMDLEKRNQKLEKRVKKLKKRKKELKEEVVKLRRTTSVQYIADDHGASTSDVEVVEESNLVPIPSNLDEELAVISDVNSNTLNEDTDAAHVEENRGLTIEEVVQGLELDNSEELDEEALDNPSGTGSSAVPNQYTQCGKGFSTPGNLSRHIKGAHGSKKECSFCHKMFSSTFIKCHIREAHMGDTRECPECKKQIRTSKFSQHMQEVHSGYKEKCPQCGKKLSLNKLARHINEVHDNVRKHCPFCPKMFYARSLKIHIRDVHHGVKVKCALCPKQFTSSNLNAHVREVHDNVRKPCPYCLKQFRSRCLKRHIRNAHQGEA